MIVYFADRQLNILGHASTSLPDGLTVIDDKRTEDVETGVAVFECKIPFDKNIRAQVEAYTEVGNYILRNSDDESELYTIIDAEIDTKNQEVYIYAEDDGMDLLNEIVGAYEADKAYPISYYINKYAAGAGFQIGINEAASLTRKLSWDGESTAAARIASVATQFDGCEVSYSFAVNGLTVTEKYINIYKERGKDIGTPLRLNEDIDRIVTIKSIANLATALQCTGGTPEEEENPITLSGYKYDDGDFYVDGAILKSRTALKRWARYLWKNEESQQAGGHIVKQFSYDTVEQKTLCAHAITELKKIRDMEVNYEVDITQFPPNLKIGDRVNIVDDAGELYLSARLLKLETSVADDKHTATLGEFLIKKSGISQKVADLASQFAASSQSASRALNIANSAYNTASGAQSQANAAAEDAANALSAMESVDASVQAATEAAASAQAAADNAQELVGGIDERIESLETSVNNAQLAADNAQLAADTAIEKADTAETSAAQAKADAADAKATATLAQTTAATATEKAESAQTTANEAKSEAATAQETADAAKLDAEQAQKDIDELKESLETITSTMTADYTRKTDLTEATASLQTQISQNAAELTSTAALVQTIDETANNAQEQASAAQATATAAQEQADKATADALAAQTAADDAATAAANAQSEADTAKAAAENARSVADKAETDLATAQADLATISSRVDATEEEIATAQTAVETAQAAADKAKADAEEATTKAANAQSTADTAVTNAENAQTAANNAASQAALAQKAADEAKGDASTAQSRADEAASIAAEAQRTANTAVTNAATAQSRADAAAQAAADAQSAADDADAKAEAAAADLATAKQNLVDVVGRVGVTEAEIEEAKEAVITAQSAADKAQEEAEAAQATADKAKSDAATAQTAADNAKAAADDAQAAADEAQKAADDAQAAVDALAVRVTTAETKITQNTEQIALMATKTEVTQTLGGYYTKSQADAAITVSADAVKSEVSSTYATKQEVADIEIGGRNLALNTGTAVTIVGNNANNQCQDIYFTSVNFQDISGEYITISFDYEYSEDTDITALARANIRPPANPFQIIANFLPTDSLSGHCVNSVPVSSEMTSVSKISTRFDYLIGSVTISNLKLERGTKATDYTPAPEDVDGEIDAAQTTANQASESATEANERITTAETLIQQLSNCISMLVTDENGESLMTQTENGWTFSMKETAEAVSSLTDLLETLQQESGSTQAAVDALQQAVSDHGEALEYVNISTYEDEPCIELGEGDSDFKLLITNTRIMFMNGANVPTYINTDGLVTQNIEVKGNIVQGGYIMLNTSDGGWGLLWTGVNN